MNGPEPGAVARPIPGLRCVLAPNPSPMTLHGTNTYLVGEGEVAVIDPGPQIPAHLAAIEAALAPGERITHVFVTHAHRDHSPLAPMLARRHHAPVLAFGPADAGRSAAMQALAARHGLGGGEGVDSTFAPDAILADGDAVRGRDWVLHALWTPGHMGNHMCFRWNESVFSGDHVMGWASSLVSPPDGDMGAYMASLERLAACRARRLFPGHGGPVTDPAARIAELTRHRLARESDIRARLSYARPMGIDALTSAIYTDTPPALLAAARRNVMAHLIDLHARGLVHADGPPGPQALFRSA